MGGWSKRCGNRFGVWDCWGRMRVEEVGKKDVGGDVRKEEFWQGGVDVCIKDVEEFVRMTK